MTYNAMRQAARRAQVRKIASALLGDLCARCGGSDRLGVYTRAGEARLFNPINDVNRRLAVVVAELEKCERLCIACATPHAACGTSEAYQSGCRCRPCKVAWSRYCSRRQRFGRYGLDVHGEIGRYRAGCRCDACCGRAMAERLRRKVVAA